MNHKVGDVVTIASYEALKLRSTRMDSQELRFPLENGSAIVFNDQMKQYCGETFVISDITSRGYYRISKEGVVVRWSFIDAFLTSYKTPILVCASADKSSFQLNIGVKSVGIHKDDLFEVIEKLTEAYVEE